MKKTRANFARNETCIWQLLSVPLRLWAGTLKRRARSRGRFARFYEETELTARAARKTRIWSVWGTRNRASGRGRSTKRTPHRWAGREGTAACDTRLPLTDELDV